MVKNNIVHEQGFGRLSPPQPSGNYAYAQNWKDSDRDCKHLF